MNDTIIPITPTVKWLDLRGCEAVLPAGKYIQTIKPYYSYAEEITCDCTLVHFAAVIPEDVVITVTLADIPDAWRPA